MSRTYQHKDSDKRRFHITLDGILCTRYYDLNIFINVESGVAALVVRTCSLGHEKGKLSVAIARGLGQGSDYLHCIDYRNNLLVLASLESNLSLPLRFTTLITSSRMTKAVYK